MIMFRHLAFVVLLLAAAIGCRSQRDTIAAHTVIYVVRHAEKADPTDRDTPLSAQGHARAEALAERLRSEGIDAVFATEFKRTQQTAAPLAGRSGREVIIVGSEDRDGLLERVRQVPPGSAVLIVGHSNTVPAIVQALSGEVVAPIAEDDFSNLYKVTLQPGGRGRLERFTYGAPVR